MRPYTKFLAIAILLGALGASARAASVSASLSTKEAYVGNPILLSVEVANARSHDAPQIPSIDGVDVRSAGTPSRSSQVSIINGRRTERSSITYAWRLIPRREGTFEIPAISVNVEGKRQSTLPLRFSATKSETGDLLFAEIVGKEEQIFVGQPMELTLRIWLRPFTDSRLNVSLSEGNMWQMISKDKSSWGMFSERLQELVENDQRPKGEEVLRADANGVERRYFLYEITATVYPKRPGRIDGDQVQVVVDYPTRLGRSRDPFESFFDRDFPKMFRDELPSMFGPRLTVTGSRPIVAGVVVNATDVMAIPTDGRPLDYRGAVGHYKIVSQATPNHVKAGDPITLHLGIQGDGPMDLVQAPWLSQIPELAADFKVAEDPLAGVVQNDVKLFTVSIRPRREGVAQIPAIPFSYFDPDTRQFVTVHSDPIKITVDAADRLALDAIVGAAGTRSDVGGENHSAPALQLTNFAGDELLVSAKPSSPWPMFVAFLAPPLAWLAVFGYRRRHRLSQLLVVRSGNHVKETLERLDDVASPRDVVETLLAFVAERTGKDKTSSLPEIIGELGDRVSHETVARLNDVVSRCEQASYGGLVAANVSQLAREAAECVCRLDTELQASSREPKATPNSPRWAGRRGKAAVAVIAAASLAVFASPEARAMELSMAQQSQILAEANALYEQARAVSASDTAEAKLAFSRAAQKYQTLVDQGIVNDRLYFNLGNAYLQSGSLGPAIANYECAVAVNPRSAAKENLEHARRLLKSHQNATVTALTPRLRWQTILAWNQQLPRAGLVVVLLLAWIGVWLAALMAHRHRILARKLILSASIVVVICATSLTLQWNQDSKLDRAIVVIPQAHLREGNGESFNRIPTVLYEGDSCDVIEQREGWLKVAANNSEGWLPSASAVLVPGHNSLR